jgi:hypothetical protein
MCTWLETQSGRGPNEVASTLISFLEIIDTKFQSQNNPPTIINLFPDFCSAQNKNQYVIIALLSYTYIKKIYENLSQSVWLFYPADFLHFFFFLMKGI